MCSNFFGGPPGPRALSPAQRVLAGAQAGLTLVKLQLPKEQWSLHQTHPGHFMCTAAPVAYDDECVFFFLVWGGGAMFIYMRFGQYGCFRK